MTIVVGATRNGRGIRSKIAEQLLCGPWNALDQLHEQGLGHNEPYAFIPTPRNAVPPCKQPCSVLSASIFLTDQNSSMLA